MIEEETIDVALWMLRCCDEGSRKSFVCVWECVCMHGV